MVSRIALIAAVAGAFGCASQAVAPLAVAEAPVAQTGSGTYLENMPSPGVGELFLTGTVDPKGLPTVCHFEYGPTDAYGFVLPCDPDPAASDEPAAVKAIATGVPEAAVRGEGHFRLVAESADGIHAGEDRWMSFSHGDPKPEQEQFAVVPPALSPPQPPPARRARRCHGLSGASSSACACLRRAAGRPPRAARRCARRPCRRGASPRRVRLRRGTCRRGATRSRG